MAPPVIDNPAGYQIRFDPREWRFLLAERSKCVFIEWEGAHGKLTDELVDRVAILSHTLGEDAVMLVDYDQHIEGFVRAASLPLLPMSLNLDVTSHAIALTPGLVEQLPSWIRDSTHAGFSSLKFVKVEGPGGMGKSPLITRLFDLLVQASPIHSETVRVEAPRSPNGDSPDSRSRIERLLEIRKRLRDSVPMLDASAWAQLRGIISPNPTAALSKYKAQNRLFSVSEGRRDLYPQFQFDDNAAPLPIMADILSFIPEDARGWPLLSWFDAHNALVGGRKPREVIRQDPDTVKSAAEEFYSQDD